VTVAATLAALRAPLAAITTPTAPVKVYADPKDATSLGEFPAIILAEAPGVEHVWGTEAMGGGSGVAIHQYTVAIYVFLGSRQSPLNELHSRSLGWSEAIFRALVANVTLSGAVIQLGDGLSNALFRYTIGPLIWPAGENLTASLWGLRCLLPVVEKPSGIVMGP
jgi:hypothetical protein